MLKDLFRITLRGRVVLVFVMLCCFGASTRLNGQQVELLTKGPATSIRGLSVVNDDLLWVSGSKGMVGRSEDAGKTWEWNQVPGFEKKEFRDIEAIDNKTAVIMAITEPAAILKTTDGGKTWKTVFEDSAKGAFIDAFHIRVDGRGYTIGDPLNGTAYILKTVNYGDSWTKESNTPKLDTGEACFASSGTNIYTLKNGKYLFVTGGRNARIHAEGFAPTLPNMIKGGESTGANSVAVNEMPGGMSVVVVGGDFARDTVSSGNCVLISAGKNPKYTNPQVAPHGYRSCVEFISQASLIACGTSGVDISNDGGKNWSLVTREGFHVCQKAKTGTAVYLAGGNGKIGKLIR